MKTVLSIAGSDSSGGAGIQADIKTITVNGAYAMTAVTALTAQNTTGVTGIYEVTPEFLAKQLEAVFDDIRPDAVKIGMVSSDVLIETIVCVLKKYNAENIVVDPVMVSTSGSALINENAVGALKAKLLPMATLVTPNIPEAEIFTGIKIENESDMERAAEMIGNAYRCSVLVKGGHSVNDANDFLYENGKAVWLKSKRINTTNTHGTGCTLSSAIATFIAKGCSTEDAVKYAKEYITGALSSGLDLGKGSGPLDHGYMLNKLLERQKK